MYQGEICNAPGMQMKLSPSPNLIERLVMRKEEHERILKQIDASIEYLKKNPDLENFMSCIREVGCL